MVRKSYKVLLLTYLVVFSLCFASLGASDYQILLSNKGTYVNDGDHQSFGPNFVPNSYFFFHKDRLYRLERVKWEYRSTRRSLQDSSKLSHSIKSQDLILHRVNVDSESPEDSFYDETDVLLHSPRPALEDLWKTVTKPQADVQIYVDRFKETEVHPTFVGDGLVSYMMVYYWYSGGAHGIGGYDLNTYSVESGSQLRIADLFTDWREVKGGLVELFVDWWNKRKEDFIARGTGPGEESSTIKDLVEAVSKEFEKKVGHNLGEKNFALTSSEAGTRLNIYFQPYTLGPYVAGGSWVSVPFGSFPPEIYSNLNYRLPKESSVGKFLTRWPDYLGFKTKHILSGGGREPFDKEYFFRAYSISPESHIKCWVAKKLMEIGDSRGLFNP